VSEVKELSDINSREDHSDQDRYHDETLFEKDSRCRWCGDMITNGGAVIHNGVTLCRACNSSIVDNSTKTTQNKCSGDLTFDESTHTYSRFGQRVPSVTEIINELCPMLFKPDDWYLQRGTAVHACAAMIAKGVDFEHDERISGQVEAIRKFFREVKPKVIESEMMIFSNTYRFAGTYDLMAKIGGKTYLLDYKASISIERTSLQLAGYSLCATPTVTNGIGVHIKEDGTYSMTAPINLQPYRREFLALRATYAVRERMGLNKREK